MEQELLANIWAMLVALMLVLYVILDGFDLGIGVLSIFTFDPRSRGMMMGSIGAIWDANETWLVLFGGALFGAFPLVYGVVLNALYVPIMLMLFGLIFRAVSFEFRAHSHRKLPWERAFGLGSLAAVAGQGLVLGGVLSQIEVGPQATGVLGFAGGPWDFMTPLSVLVMLAVVLGYVMIGASYLILKVPAEMQRRVHRMVLASSIAMFLLIVAITLTMPFLSEFISHKWLAGPYAGPLWALGTGAAFAFAMLLLVTVYRKYTRLPFLLSLLVFVLAFAGMGTALYPYLVPPSITIQQAASSKPTLVFMLFGIGLLIPVMLLYNFYLYRVFSGGLHEPGQEYEQE